MENKVIPYRSGWEQISDELKRLDTILQLYLARQSFRRRENIPGQLPGMVIFSEEIESLFEDENGAVMPDDARVRALEAQLALLDGAIEARRSMALQMGIDLPLARLADIFGLSPFEEQCLIICLAPELDRKYEKIYAYLQDDLTQKKPSIGLVLQLLLPEGRVQAAARGAFDPRSPLARFLLKVIDNAADGTTPFIGRALKLEDQVLNFLLESGRMEPRLAEVSRMMAPEPAGDEWLVFGDQERTVTFLAKSREDWINGLPEQPGCLLFCYGPDDAGKMAYVRQICGKLGIKVLLLDMDAILASGYPWPEILDLAAREAVLQNAALCVANFDHWLEEEDKCQIKGRHLLEMAGDIFLTFLLGNHSWKPEGITPAPIFIEREFPIPGDQERHMFWKKLSRDYRLESGADLGALAGEFRFTAGQIRDSLVMAHYLSQWLHPEKEEIEIPTLYKACRSQTAGKLDTLARKIATRQTWEMLVLPPETLELLHEICDQVKYRHLVYGEWGFGRRLTCGKGLNALFSGPPGSGKTMAAEVIARDLRLELYQIDLARVVSKYIGETEKNLSRIFKEAQTANAILFFDESDALFGKRSEVKDAHDRYANIETGFLLKQMEEYEGIVILATNLRNNMDEAFLRRLHFVVEFPFPEKEERVQIFRKIFPVETPLAEGIDYEFLSGRLKLAGGNIKNIAINAAFQAARDGRSVGMRELLTAARREYRKIGKPFLKSEFEPYYQLIEE